MTRQIRMMRMAALALFLCLAPSSGFRVRQKKKTKAVGTVDALYIYGAPGVSDIGLSNKGECIPGVRVYSSYKSWGVTFLDFATIAAKTMGFKHNKMAAAMFDTKSSRVQEAPCGTDVDPGLSSVSFSIHHSHDTYVAKSNHVSSVPHAVRALSLENSYILDWDEVRGKLSGTGWSLAGSANELGENQTGGPQVSHLMKRDDDGVCMLSWQGTNSPEDIAANLDASKVPFCGVEGLVHKGFRDNMMRMIKSPQYQQNIRPKLPSCNKVWVMGHSMGGALASLFTACVYQQDTSSDDYNLIKW